MKWLFRIFLIGLLVSLVIGAVAYCSLKTSQPPKKEDAPYALQSYYQVDGLKVPTRYYYAESIEIESGRAVMTNYWKFDGKRYNKIKGSREIEPPYTVIRRIEQ